MQFVYLTPQKQRVGRIFLEGYHTYKRKFLCYNRLVSLQDKKTGKEARRLLRKRTKNYGKKTNV